MSDHRLQPHPRPVAMRLVTAAIWLVVYYRLGLRMLRQVWFNLDWLWALALIGSGTFAAAAR